MKNKKKLLVVLLTLTMLLLMTACGSKPSDTPPAGDQSTSEPRPSDSGYPDSPITLLVGQAAGGSTDVIARNLQVYLNKYLGVNVVVENVTGGAGKVCLAQFAKEKPDGYTLLLGVLPAWYLTQTSDNAPSYELKDFIPIGGSNGHDYNCFCVPVDSPIQSVEDLVEIAKTRTVTMAGSGIGGNGYFAYFLLSSFSGADIKFIPFDSGSEAVVAAMGGNADCVVTSVLSAASKVKDGQLRCIGTTGPDRASQLPDVLTMEEQGYDGFAYDISFGLMALPGTPDNVVAALEEAMQSIVNDPDFIDSCESGNLGYFPMDADEYAAHCEEMFSFVDSYADEFLAAIEKTKNS